MKRAYDAAAKAPMVKHKAVASTASAPFKEWISGVYLPEQLAREALSLTYFRHYQYTFQNTHVDLYVLVKSQDQIQDQDQDFIKAINLTIAFLSRVSKHHAKRIQLLWVPLDAPKTTANHCVPQTPCILGPTHVNSGYTSSMYCEHDRNCGHIVVYRKEEACKVCIHEIVHFWDYDTELLDGNAQRELTTYLQSAFDLKTLRVPLAPREAVTDAVAIMLYACLQNPDAWHPTLLQHRAHIIKQAAKVLKLQHVKQFPNVEFSEHTHVFSYYVLKAAMYYDLGTWLQVMQKRDPLLTKDYCIVAIMRKAFARTINAWLKKPWSAFDSSMRMSMPAAAYPGATL